MDKLALYNGSLALLGARKLASLTENQLSRRELDGVFSRGGIRTCLELGQWNFAMRTVQLDYSPSVEPSFGYSRAFDKPTDWVRTCGLCADAMFREPLLEVADEAAFWFATLDTIFVRFVSDSTDYGLDYSKWPENFSRVVEHHFAIGVCMRLTQSQQKKNELELAQKIWLARAKSSDAMDEATTFPPESSWTRARRGNSRRDLGSRTRLIG